MSGIPPRASVLDHIAGEGRAQNFAHATAMSNIAFNSQYPINTPGTMINGSFAQGTVFTGNFDSQGNPNYRQL